MYESIYEFNAVTLKRLFLLCLNTFTSQIICLWLTTIWNNTFTSEIWCLWLTHDPASRWLMASSVTTSRRIALLYFVLCTLLYFGFTLQSSCCVQAPKAVAGGTCSALLYICCTLLLVQSCWAVSARTPGGTSRQAAKAAEETRSADGSSTAALVARNFGNGRSYVMNCYLK